MRGEIWKPLGRGCRVWLTPPPFDHTKLLVVDGVWSLVGSANWDPRSLRLNFELGLECYDDALARDRDALIEEKIGTARELHGLRFLQRRRSRRGQRRGPTSTGAALSTGEASCSRGGPDSTYGVKYEERARFSSLGRAKSEADTPRIA